MKKALHNLATKLGLTPYTLEDIVEEAQKTNEKQIIITALKNFVVTEECCPGKYQPVAIFGKNIMNIGKPIHLDFNPKKYGSDPRDSRYESIQRRQKEVEKILRNYINGLCKRGINAEYRDFDRSSSLS